MVLLTIDLLPNISLVVGQSSVNISLTLCAREISTSRPTSNQLSRLPKSLFKYKIQSHSNYIKILYQFHIIILISQHHTVGTDNAVLVLISIHVAVCNKIENM